MDKLMHVDAQQSGSASAPTCPLDKAVSYENPEVVSRFVQLYEVTFEEAADVFMETKKWLWLASQVESGALSITDSLLIIDEMWHNFVLFTLDYTRYCNDRFGRYIHHAPTTLRDKERRRQAFEDDPVRAGHEHASRVQRQCDLIAAKLGGATLLKWYVDYPARYDHAFFASGRKAVSLACSPPASLQSLASLVRIGRVKIGALDP
jgi:hypothetical protein